MPKFIPTFSLLNEKDEKKVEFPHPQCKTNGYHRFLTCLNKLHLCRSKCTVEIQQWPNSIMSKDILPLISLLQPNYIQKVLSIPYFPSVSSLFWHHPTFQLSHICLKASHNFQGFLVLCETDFPRQVFRN